MSNLEDQFNEWAMGHNVQPCPMCGVPIIKSEGCNHMTCTGCRHEWCWICRKPYTADHYAPWNLFGCAGAQFRDMTPAELKRRMVELHNPRSTFLSSCLSALGTLLVGACPSFGVVAIFVRMLLGNGREIGIQREIEDRLFRDACLTFAYALIYFLILCCSAPFLLCVGLLASLLCFPPFACVQRCVGETERYSIVLLKVLMMLIGFVLWITLIPTLGVTCAVAMIVFGPAVYIIFQKTKLLERSKFLCCIGFCSLIFLTPAMYAIAIVVIVAGAAILIPLVVIFGPSGACIMLGRKISCVEALLASRGICMKLWIYTALGFGGLVGMPLIYAGAAGVFLIGLWITIHLFVFGMMLEFMKDTYLSRVASSYESSEDVGFDIAFYGSLFLPSLLLIPLMIPYAFGLVVRGMTEAECFIALTTGVVAAVMSTLLISGLRSPSLMFMSGTILSGTFFVVASVLAFRLTVLFKQSPHSDGPWNQSTTKLPALLMWWCLLPSCAVLVICACPCIPLTLIYVYEIELSLADAKLTLKWRETPSQGLTAKLAVNWVVHWFALLLLPSEFLVNFLFGTACTIRGFLAARRCRKLGMLAFWIALPISPLVWVLACCFWSLLVISGWLARRPCAILNNLCRVLYEFLKSETPWNGP